MTDHDEIWSARGSLAHIRIAARARMCGPWAVLGAVLAQTVAQIPPAVHLPAIVGGRSTPNLFVALVGPSGAGKGAGTACAGEAVRYTRGGREAPPVDPTPIGSGEGIARTYRPHAERGEEPESVDRALFSVAEIDSLAGLLARTGQTLDATLRMMWSGETLGAGNSGRDTRVIVPAMSYRAALIAGVQPARAWVLLDAADGGLPQRLVWTDVADPEAPDIAPPWPGSYRVELPEWPTGPLPVPARAVDEIRAHRLAVLRSDETIDPLDGHALQTRLRVAVALGVLDGRAAVADADWQLAGAVMDESDRVRADVIAVRAAARKRANRARAHDAADREETIADRRARRAAESIMRHLGRGPARRADVYRGMRSDIRAEMGAAITDLSAAGKVVMHADGTLVAVDPPVHTVHTSTAGQSGYRAVHIPSTSTHVDGPRGREKPPLTRRGRVDGVDGPPSDADAS